MLNFNNDTVKNGLAIFVVMSFICFVIMWTFFQPVVDVTTLNFLSGLLGLHGGWAAMIINYYFSSSASSSRKDEIIAASGPPRDLPVIPDPEKKPVPPAPPASGGAINPAPKP